MDDPAPVGETTEAFVSACGAAAFHLPEPEVGAVGEVEFLRGFIGAHIEEAELNPPLSLACLNMSLRTRFQTLISLTFIPDRYSDKRLVREEGKRMTN